jgi:hypothetical protein
VIRRALMTVAALALFSASGGAATTNLGALEKAAMAQPESPDRTHELAEAYRASGDLQRGVAFFTAFHKSHKPNALSLAWQGSLKTATSASGEDMEQRLDLLESGLADMDRAVRLFPEDLRVLLVRAVTMSHFPAFLGMQGKAVRDLETLVAADRLSAGARAAAREALARLYRETGRAGEADQLLATGQASAGR